MQFEEIIPYVKRVVRIHNLGGLRISSSPHFRGKFVKMTRLLAKYVEVYPLSFLPDYASLLGRNYSELKRAKSRRRGIELLRELIGDVEKRYGELRLVEVLENVYNEGVTYKVADLVDIVSSGIPFNVWVGSKMCELTGGQCIVEPTFTDVEPAQSFDIALLTRRGPITYIEVKRTLRTRLRQWVLEEMLDFTTKTIRILMSFGLMERGAQKITLALAVFTPVHPPKSIIRLCKEKTEELSGALKYSLAENVVFWAGSYKEVRGLTKMFSELS